MKHMIEHRKTGPKGKAEKPKKSRTNSAYGKLSIFIPIKSGQEGYADFVKV